MATGKRPLAGRPEFLPVVTLCCQSGGPPSAMQFCYGQSVNVLSTKKSGTTLVRWMSRVEIE